MALVNENYLKLPENYLFKEIARKINVFKTMRPKSDMIHLDFGDSKIFLKIQLLILCTSQLIKCLPGRPIVQTETLQNWENLLFCGY